MIRKGEVPDRRAQSVAGNDCVEFFALTTDPQAHPALDLDEAGHFCAQAQRDASTLRRVEQDCAERPAPDGDGGSAKLKPVRAVVDERQLLAVLVEDGKSCRPKSARHDSLGQVDGAQGVDAVWRQGQEHALGPDLLGSAPFDDMRLKPVPTQRQSQGEAGNTGAADGDPQLAGYTPCGNQFDGRHYMDT